MKAPPVCMDCKQPITDPFGRFERRTEYRNARTQDRERTRKLGDVCRHCMLVELGEAEAPKQGTLA